MFSHGAAPSWHHLYYARRHAFMGHFNALLLSEGRGAGRTNVKHSKIRKNEEGKKLRLKPAVVVVVWITANVNYMQMMHHKVLAEFLLLFLLFIVFLTFFPRFTHTPTPIHNCQFIFLFPIFICFLLLTTSPAAAITSVSLSLGDIPGGSIALMAIVLLGVYWLTTNQTERGETI